jgi:hypothetical protein
VFCGVLKAMLQGAVATARVVKASDQQPMTSAMAAHRTMTSSRSDRVGILLLQFFD